MQQRTPGQHSIAAEIKSVPGVQRSLRGPRGAMIFFRKGEKGVDKKGNKLFYDLENRINECASQFFHQN